MEEKKKKKLTLTISKKGSFTPSNYSLGRQKKSFVIEKKVSRSSNFRKSYERNDNINKTTSTYSDKTKPKLSRNLGKDSTINRNFEIRKKAEERATKRFRNLKEDEVSSKKINLNKNKSSTSKREYKLTLSRALNEDEMDGKERSLASVRRARLKEKKNLNDSEKKQESQW